MVRSLARTSWWVAVVAVLGGGALAAVAGPKPLSAQGVRCYIVACSGNVCVWKEIACPAEAQ
ncbi:MAG TPA: hypothetical protein VHG35_11740 [Gemmatimonadales bacterium]|nr:hypothetical protein [Gemmatimonadales bacterium]